MKVALVCVNGAKECCGCFECRDESENEVKAYCSVCGLLIPDGEVYTDLLYDKLCVECLKALHRQ